MKFTPKTEEELTKEGLLADGEYGFEVLKAEDKKSQRTGEEMIELNLKIYETADGGPFLFDYLLESMGYKLRHFCEETGLLEAYESGTLTAQMCVGKGGRLQIGTEPPKNGYKAKNKVKDYGAKKVKGAVKQFNAVAPAGQTVPEAKDDCPFGG